MFNLSGSEIIAILLLALVVLGPEKLPEALRRAGKAYAELRKMGSTFQAEMRSVIDEPMKEMRDTADLLRKAARFDDDGDTRPATANRARPTLTPGTEDVGVVDDDDDADGLDDDEDVDDEPLSDDELVLRTLGGGDTARRVDPVRPAGDDSVDDDGNEAPEP